MAEPQRRSPFPEYSGDGGAKPTLPKARPTASTPKSGEKAPRGPAIRDSHRVREKGGEGERRLATATQRRPGARPRRAFITPAAAMTRVPLQRAGRAKLVGIARVSLDAVGVPAPKGPRPLPRPIAKI